MDHQNQPILPGNQVALVPRPSARPTSRAHYLPENPYGFDYEDDRDDGNGLLDYWRILARHKRAILLAAFAGLLFGFCICIPMRPVYRAQTTLEVLALNQDFLNMKQASPTSATDGSLETSEEATQSKLLQSVTLSKRVFEKLSPGSFTVRSKAPPAQSGWRAILHLPERTPVTPRQALLSRAADTLKVRETAHTRVLEISVDSPDPQLAADYANTLTHEFIAENAEERWQSTQNTSDWLRRELDDARDKLRHSEDALQDYARQSGIILTDESTNVATEKLQQLQQELSTATADRISKQSRFELAQRSPPQSLADVLNDTSLRDTQSKINDLQRQIADLGAIYSPEYSKVRRLQAELDSLKLAFNTERGEILSRIQTDYQEANRKERLLSAAYYEQTHEVTGQGEKTIQYNILKREVDSNRQLYDTMLQQMKQSSIASAMRASNVRVVDAADVPELPVSPNFKIASAVGMLAGALFSSIIVIVRDQLDRTLQKPGDIKLWTDLPELGAIPNAAINFNNRRYKAMVTAPVLPSQSRTSNGNLVLDSEQSTPLAEAFRSALTSILFAAEEGNRPRTLLITSASPGDGKTTIVSNIALAAAEIRMKVLIIDADLRRPRMHQLFDLPNEFGLGELLTGQLEPSDVARAVQPTRVANLYVLTAGLPTQAAAHLLHSPEMNALLKKFAVEFDIVLIDTPPMMQMTDARVVARQADAVVLVARAGQTSRDELVAAKRRFEEDRIPVIGSMLNNWDPRLADEYKYYPSAQYSRNI